MTTRYGVHGSVVFTVEVSITHLCRGKTFSENCIPASKASSEPYRLGFQVEGLGFQAESLGFRVSIPKPKQRSRIDC